MNKFGKDVNTLTIGDYTFTITYGNKYYQYGGRYHNDGFDEDMYIDYTLTVKKYQFR